MPSPFPGMDPWLERSTVWPGFHEMLIVKAVEVLQPLLRSRGYYVDIGERVWLAEPGRGVLPDDVTLQPSHPLAGASGYGVILTVDEPVRIARAPVEVREGYLEIFDTLGHQLVTGLEFLSPTNKSHRKGRRLYRRKQAELRRTGVHLVEIDFLRRGRHVLDVPQETVDGLRPWDYFVNLVRRGSDEYEVYPIKLRDRLPRIRIPLKSEDDDAVLDLQEVFDRSYEIGPYPERLNYSAPPSPPLNDQDAAWADELLKSKGLR